MADFKKTAFEEFTIDCDFSSNMSDSDTIQVDDSSVTVIDRDLVDQSDTMVATGSVAADGKKLTAKIVGGTNGNLYDVKFKITTGNGEKYEADRVLDVRD